MKLNRSRIQHIVVLSAVAITVAGCMTPPKTPAEFRAMAKGGGMFLSSDTYTVKRPYPQVVGAYRQKAPACLNQTIETTTRDKYGTHVSSYTWTARINATDKHMECTMQLRGNNANEVEVYDPPNKYGHYHLLVDAYPVDQGSTRIVVSKTITVPDTVILAAKNWATGENMGCPDMTQ